jgi:signal peptidase I
MMECSLCKVCFGPEWLLYIALALLAIWFFMEKGKFKPFLSSLGFALIVAFFLRGLLMEPYGIPSGSMIPTMLVGDYLYVSKLSYGYSKHSFPFLIPNIGDGKRLFGDQPKHGDVVVFKLPPDNCVMYIKRLIGMPGDTVQVVGGITYVNGKPLPQRRIEDFTLEEHGNKRMVAQFIETMPNGREYHIIRYNRNSNVDSIIPDGNQLGDNYGPYTVPEGHYFMMGDNRNDSGDSRMHVGPVPYDHLIGQAKFIFFSIDSNIFDIVKVWKWPDIIRLRRFFSTIQAPIPDKKDA